MKLTKSDINHIFSKIKKLAVRAYHKGNYGQAIRYVECASMIAYQTNISYADDDLEELNRLLSCKLLGENTEIPATDSKRIVFYDSSGVDNVALTQQYLNAFIAWGIEFLYILNNPYSNEKRGAHIFEILKKDTKASVYIVPRDFSRIEKIQAIYLKITEFAPAKGILHLAPGDIIPLLIFNNLSWCERYMINMTDHAFWLGKNAADYFLEFRGYGQTISIERRHIAPDRLLALPYYPIVSCQSFKGLPPLPEKDMVRIFSGGALYKTYGDQKKYFCLLELLLNNNSNIVIYIAGSGNEAPYRKFIRKNHYENRLFLIGQRDDIVHVFRHIDIYLSTYPIGGGLMTQLAAVNKIPILAFADKNISCKHLDALLPYGKYGNEPFTKDNLTSFHQYANRLINDVSFRRQEGTKLQQRLISPELFNRLLYDHLFQTPKNPALYEPIEVDYKAVEDIYMEVENEYMHNCIYELISTFKWKISYFFPKSTVILMQIGLKRETILRVLKRVKKGYGIFRRN